MSAASSDGRRVVTASTDNTARIWDAENGKELVRPLQHEVAMEGGHETGVVTAAFSPDGKRIVTAGKDNTARVWNAQTGEPLGTPMRHDAYVVAASFSSDGERILTAAGEFGKPGVARIWDAKSGHALIEPLRHDDGVTTAAFSAEITVWSQHRSTRRATGIGKESAGRPAAARSLVTSAKFV